jgi:C-terminal processing protease CtpA/Prc
MIRNIPFCLLASFSFFLFGAAVSPAQHLPKKETQQVITKMAKLIADNYVFPEKGEQIAAYLVQEYRKGKFNSATTWRAFDSLTTRSIQEVSHDGHMYVRYDPKTTQELSAVKKEAEPEVKGDFSEDPFFYGPNAAQQNFGFKEVKVLDGNIGYIKLTEINISEKSLPTLHGAMALVAHTKALVLDLRNNGGGGSAIGSVLESYFLPKETPLLVFRSRTGQTNAAKTVAWLTEKQYEKPLYILTNNATVSAAEAFTYALQRHQRAKVVGQRTAGGAHMNSWYPLNEHSFISVSTGAPTWPGTNESWEGKGVQPDYVVTEEKALEFIKDLVRQM